MGKRDGWMDGREGRMERRTATNRVLFFVVHNGEVEGTRLSSSRLVSSCLLSSSLDGHTYPSRSFSLFLADPG